MQGRRWTLVGMLVWLAVGPAAAAGADDAESLRAMVRALKDRLETQDRRLADLEAKVGKDAAGVKREELKRLVAEACAAAAPAPNDLRVYWKDGLRLDSADGQFKLKLGGRVHMDWTWATGDEIEREAGIELDDGVEFRRVRLGASGLIYGNVAYKLEFDFADGDADLKDAYVRLTDVPVVGHVTVGHFKEPFSLSELTSSNSIMFVERALPMVFPSSRNDGIMVHNAVLGKRATWAVGLFRDADDYGESTSDGGYNVTARLTGLPWRDDAGLVHLGAAYSYRTPQDAIRIRQRPEAHQLDWFVDTGELDVDHMHVFGAEAAWVYGPFCLQGEYLAAMTDTDQASGLDDPFFHGFYVQASYFLTGEQRPYKTGAGVFGRVRPKRNFRDAGGWGAWEVAVRYSYLDLDESDVDGGRLENVTVGLNWYLNPNTRVMWNWIHPELHTSTYDTDIMLMRVQVDF